MKQRPISRLDMVLSVETPDEYIPPEVVVRLEGLVVQCLIDEIKPVYIADNTFRIVRGGHVMHFTMQ